MLKIFKHLFPLFLIQFFTWLALFALWIYATPVITKYFFNTTNADSNSFETGLQWVGICFALYSVLGAFLIFLIPLANKKFKKTTIHSFALLMGSIGLFLIYFLNKKYSLVLSFVFIGIAWSSISSIPYKLVSAIAPPQKMINYFAVFNFSTVIPQVTSAFGLNYMLKKFFNNETKYIMLFGSGCMLLAAVLMFFLFYHWQETEIV